jgi:hypothetical protein
MRPKEVSVSSSGDCYVPARQGSKAAAVILGLVGFVLAGPVEAESKTVVIFEGRQVSVDVPSGWTFKESRDRSTGVQTLEILDPGSEIQLDISFLPDSEGQLDSRDALEARMRTAFQFYLDGSVEPDMKFTYFDEPDGLGGYTSFTDRSLVGHKIPKGERLVSTAGMRSWKGTFLIFTLLANAVDTKTYQDALGIVRTGLTQTGGPNPDSCAQFQQALRKTYGFSPSKLDKKEQAEKSQLMDGVWNQVKKHADLIPCLERAVDAERQDWWFVFDASQLLDSVAPSPESKRRLLLALTRVSLDDVDLRTWVELAATLGIEGLDTSELGRRWLTYPKARYWLPEHGAYEVTHENGALFIFGSLDEQFATPALIALTRSESGSTREIAVWLLMTQATPEAVQALATLDRGGLSQSALANLDVLLGHPTLITPRKPPKTSREQFRSAFDSFLKGDEQPLERLIEEVPDGEHDLVAVFGAGDLAQLREVRRRYAARGNQHAIEYYKQFSQILMTFVWRPELTKRTASRADPRG